MGEVDSEGEHVPVWKAHSQRRIHTVSAETWDVNTASALGADVLDLLFVFLRHTRFLTPYTLQPAVAYPHFAVVAASLGINDCTDANWRPLGFLAIAAVNCFWCRRSWIASFVPTQDESFFSS